MKGHVYKTILISLTVCNIKVAGQGCAQGEPKIGEKPCKLSLISILNYLILPKLI